ncbi:TPA: hypothetical protein ACKTE9_006046 [Pseudomonas aeruginosa]
MEQSVTGAKIGIGHDRFPVAFRFFVIELGQQLNDGKGLGVFRAPESSMPAALSEYFFPSARTRAAAFPGTLC